jgi:hypothetical protein
MDSPLSCTDSRASVNPMPVSAARRAASARVSRAASAAAARQAAAAAHRAKSAARHAAETAGAPTGVAAAAASPAIAPALAPAAPPLSSAQEQQTRGRKRERVPASAAAGETSATPPSTRRPPPLPASPSPATRNRAACAAGVEVARQRSDGRARAEQARVAARKWQSKQRQPRASLMPKAPAPGAPARPVSSGGAKKGRGAQRAGGGFTKRDPHLDALAAAANEAARLAARCSLLFPPSEPFAVAARVRLHKAITTLNVYLAKTDPFGTVYGDFETSADAVDDGSRERHRHCEGGCADDGDAGGPRKSPTVLHWRGGGGGGAKTADDESDDSDDDEDHGSDDGDGGSGGDDVAGDSDDDSDSDDDESGDDDDASDRRLNAH